MDKKRVNFNTVLLLLITGGLSAVGYLAKEQHEDTRATREAIIVIKQELPLRVTKAEFDTEMMKCHDRLALLEAAQSAQNARQSAQDARLAAIEWEVSKGKRP